MLAHVGTNRQAGRQAGRGAVKDGNDEEQASKNSELQTANRNDKNCMHTYIYMYICTYICAYVFTTAIMTAIVPAIVMNGGRCLWTLVASVQIRKGNRGE